MRFFVVSLFLAVFLPQHAKAEEIPQKVDDALATKLVTIITKHQGVLVLPGRYDHFDDSEHPFLIYHQMGLHTATITWFAVNVWTGDVWDIGGGDNCIQYNNDNIPALRKELDKIKSRFSKQEMKDYTRLRALRPGRMWDLEPCGSPR